MRIEKITERDYEILKHLSYGPSNIISIGKKFFLKQEASKEFSKYAWRRLAQLQNAGLIQCRKVDRHDSPIVVLQKAGAYEVALKYGFEIGKHALCISQGNIRPHGCLYHAQDGGRG